MRTYHWHAELPYEPRFQEDGKPGRQSGGSEPWPYLSPTVTVFPPLPSKFDNLTASNLGFSVSHSVTPFRTRVTAVHVSVS